MMASTAPNTPARKALAARIKAGARFVNEDALTVEPDPKDPFRSTATCPSCGHRHMPGLYATTCICGRMDQCMECYRCCKCDYPLRKVEDPT